MPRNNNNNRYNGRQESSRDGNKREMSNMKRESETREDKRSVQRSSPYPRIQVKKEGIFEDPNSQFAWHAQEDDSNQLNQAPSYNYASSIYSMPEEQNREYRQRKSPIGFPDNNNAANLQQHQVEAQENQQHRPSVFNRLSWKSTNAAAYQDISPNASNEDFSQPPMISMQNYMFGHPMHGPTPPIEIPCSSAIIKRLSHHKMDSIPSKYDMVAQKEIAKLQNRALVITANPATPITDDGTGINNLYMMPTGTGISMHKRFA